MALNSNAVTSQINAPTLAPPNLDVTLSPAIKADAAPASPITVEQANALADALRPTAGGLNPVAEVQAKLRAAMEATPPPPSTLQNAAFGTLLTVSCAFMVIFGVALGIVCVLFGAAMFLFPVSAGTALGGFVLAVGALFYFIYTRGVRQKSAKPADTFEPLAAGRFSAVWGS